MENAKGTPTPMFNGKFKHLGHLCILKQELLKCMDHCMGIVVPRYIIVQKPMGPIVWLLMFGMNLTIFEKNKVVGGGKVLASP